MHILLLSQTVCFYIRSYVVYKMPRFCPRSCDSWLNCTLIIQILILRDIHIPGILRKEWNDSHTIKKKRTVRLYKPKALNAQFKVETKLAFIYNMKLDRQLMLNYRREQSIEIYFYRKNRYNYWMSITC